MGKPSTQAKQRYNERTYKHMKISVKPETATAFKSACEKANVSMASELSMFMSHYVGTIADKPKNLPDLSAKRHRRAAVCNIIKLLESIKINEERCRDNMPNNLRGGSAFENAEQSISLLDDAIELLESVY